MSNEVEIKVKSTDQTDYSKIKAKAKSEGGKAGDDAGKAFGRSAGKGFGKGGEDATKGFGSKVKKWFTGSGTKLFGEGGAIGGEAFKNGLGGILKTPVLGPVIAGGLLGAVATVAPAAGALAATGLVAAFGAGLAGLGIAFAAKSPAVQAAWKKTLSDMGAQMTLLSKPFEKTLFGLSEVAKRTFASFAPALASSFKKIAPAVLNFGDQAGKAFEKLVPAIAPLSDAFTAVLATMGPALQSAIGNVSRGISDLAESVKKSPGALADMTEGVGKLGNSLLSTLTQLNDTNAAFSRVTNGTSAVDVIFGTLNGTIKAQNGLLSAATAPINGASWALEKLGLRSKESGQSTASFSSTLGGVAAAIGKALVPTETLATKFARQKSATDALVQSLFQLQNGYLTLSNAQISYQAAVDATTQSVKDNGKNLDINTEKGRNNQSALNALAQAANGQTESMLRNNKGMVAAYGSAAKARENFVKLAQQMGATKPQAEAMAKSMIAIPNVSRTARLQANKKDLEKKLAAAKKELADPKLTATRKAQLRAEISNLEAGIYRATHLLASIPSSKTVTIRYTTTGVNVSTPSSVGRKWAGGPVMQHMSKGGTPLSSREFLAGEYGEEIVKVDGTGNVRVTPAGNTSRRLSQTGGVQEIRLVLEGRGDVGDFLIKMLQPAIRNRGGNVNVVLAGRPA